MGRENDIMAGARVYVAPADSPIPEDPSSWEELGTVDGPIFEEFYEDTTEHIKAFQEAIYSMTLKLELTRMAFASLAGIPYRHPRQVLHNGRKP